MISFQTKIPQKIIQLPYLFLTFYFGRNKKLKKDTGVELFSGEFWSGKKSKELGLIDGLGNAEQILREKFGEDVEVKVFEKSKGWLAKKLSSSEDHADKLISVIEERSIWQRYGF